MEQISNRQDFKGLYSPQFEHDNCGIGAVVNINGIKTHDTVANALTIVETLEHRAGKDAEGKTGDGVGILLQISHKFFKKVAQRDLGIKLLAERDYAVGMFFFPQNELARNQAKKMFEIIAEKEGLEILGWRNVPSNPDVLGKRAVECMPHIMQCFIKRPKGVKKGLPFDRKLYVARRVFEQSNEDTYVVSLSSRTIVYKGMFLVGELRRFFTDLQDPDYESAIAMVHSRFSTNTNPSWQRAHPNRMIVHNGEINTIRGNADKMLAREETMRSEHLKGDLDKVIPVVNTEGSDSAMLDNTLEFLVMSGMELPLAVMITIPEPWDNNGTMSQKKKDFYQYYATMMEPWDGPASILFSDGEPSDSNVYTETEASVVKLIEAVCTVITVGLGLNNETATWLGEKVASAGCAFTADTAEELNKIFQNIQSTITQSRSLTGVQVTDIIDAEFELTDAEIQRLRADGAQVTVNEDGTTTVSWLDQEVKPKENGASGRQKTIHIVAKESCLGGNNMTTNVNPYSFLSFGGTQLELPQPTVNVRIAYQITDTADTIFLGENLENYADDAAVRMKDADSAKMTTV